MAIKKAQAEKEIDETISESVKMGRPQKEIDEAILDKLLFMQASQEECAYWFDCSIATIERWCVRVKNATFAEYATKRQGLGKIGVRRALFQQINKGNTLLIKFACETILGMKAGEYVEATNPYLHPVTKIDPPVEKEEATNESE